ncbi:MAG: chromosome segregation ATPase [Leptolyngbyaceae cyanobacterium T60_A2020_046]|nr:chromosome segregation ATPase [Leptolyngbyaceae cyanobacterium T60_A2020_046]
MSTSQNPPRQFSSDPYPRPRPSATGQPSVPPPRRDQRPRPAVQLPQNLHPQPSRPRDRVRPTNPAPSLSDPWGSSAELNDLRHQLQQPAAPSRRPVPPPSPTVRKPRDRRPPAPSVPKDISPTPQRSLSQRLAGNWPAWSALALVTLGGVTTVAALSLFRIPNLPNCRAIFWPTASATTRLQCADAYADQGTVESLLAAIALVEQLPDDHPLRPELNERVEQWAGRILDIASDTFHAGELDQAIAIARRIPADTAAAGQVAERITEWEQIWQSAEDIFATAEQHLRASKFAEAFTEAIKLRSVGNTYWETTKYEELTGLITIARQDVNTLGEAKRLADRGSVDAVLEALEMIATIDENSHLYGEAQGLMKEISRRLLDFAEEALAREDGQAALDILAKIPSEANLSAEVADFRTLAEAYELTWTGSVVGYETAIARLQIISSDRPLHGRARLLIQRWQRELEGVAHLDWARRVAIPGTVPDLRAAITEAEKISSGNPLWDEAQTQIRQWRRQISLIEDGPYLDQAQALASAGDRAALTAAIETASNIPSSSAIYEEARELIADWRWQIQQMNNEPILARARQLAAAGNLSDAVAVATQIPSGQAYYDEAQTAIAQWRGEVRGQNLTQAYQRAQAGNVSALVDAIAIAQGIPQSSSNWQEAQRAINQWSWDILRIAEAEAAVDLNSAIAVADRVPQRTEAYASAQLKLQEWRDRRGSTP